MRKRISRVAATIGMVTGLVIISGSLVGGIALASNHDDAPPPAATVPSDSPSPTGSTTESTDSPEANEPSDGFANNDEPAEHHTVATPTASTTKGHDDDPSDDHEDPEHSDDNPTAPLSP